MKFTNRLSPALVVATAATTTIPAPITTVAAITTATAATASTIITPIATPAATAEVALATATSTTAEVPLATTTAVIARSTTEAAGTIFLRTGFDYLHRATTYFLPIDAIDRSDGLRVVWHLNETKSTGATCLTIQYDACAGHDTKGFESCTQLVIGERVAEVTDVEIH